MPRKKYFKIIGFIVLIFLVEIISGLFLKYFQDGKWSADIFYKSADHSEFFKPANTLAIHGKYAMNSDSPPYAGRLPGYIFPYVLFRVIFSEDISLYLLGIFQLLLKAVSAWFLCNLVSRFKNEIFAYLSVFIYLFIPYFWHWDYNYHPNSVSVSVYIILLCLLYNFKLNTGKLLLSGTLLSYIFFTRPFTGFYLIIIPLFVFYTGIKRKESLVNATLKTILFLLPFLIAESLWVTRNYRAFGRIVLLQTSFVPFAENSKSDYSYGSATKFSALKIRSLIASWGGQTFWYFPGEMMWFFGRDSNYVFPDHAMTKSLNTDSMKLLQKDLVLSYHNNFTDTQKDSLEKAIIQRAEMYTGIYREERPLDYWVLSKFRKLKVFLAQNVTQDWPGPSFSKSNILYKMLKLFSFMEYLAALLIFIFFFYGIKNKTPFHWMIIGNVISICFTFAVLVEASHYSLFITSYAGLLLLVFSGGIHIKIRKSESSLSH